MSFPPALREVLGEARWVSRKTGKRLPDVPGSYVLMIRLSRKLALDMPGLGNPVLTRGWYAYCGSAHGPGGIRARVCRHMRREKTLRWHVDRLTICAGEVRAAAFDERGECDLVAMLLEAGFDVPVPGFGSTDCRACPAHLLRWPGQRAALVGTAVT